ncbi:MAG: DUF4954 family protein [Pirellulales bacterium]
MNHRCSPVDAVRVALDGSELIRDVRCVKQDAGTQLALGTNSIRRLSAEEIEQLEVQGNVADDWSRVQVADSFDAGSVRQSSFHGDVILGHFGDCAPAGGGAELPCGVYQSVLSNCVVGSNALVHGVGLLSNYVVGQRAVVYRCNSVTCEGTTAFGNGQELPIAIETGGREVGIFAEIDVQVAAVVARSRSDRKLVDAYTEAVADYTSQATSMRGIIADSAVVRNTTTVRNSYIGRFAVVDGATLVADSTLLSSEEEPTRIESGACVTDSIFQWGSDATTMGLVASSVMTEHSHVERHGKLTDSILGPNSGVAEGEATACLLGPFVGFHHQALLIAVLWPEGKGNVGYGANVGSNHTSKAPDQECWPGEGAFFGLGTNIKFPSDFSRAPYSIIASGVSALPQKVTFPFSLINSPFANYEGISPAYNEIIPAWLLTDNMYTLKRNEGKYKDRNKARRTRFVFDVFRPDTIDLMRDACNRLEAVQQVKEFYIDREINGLGKNFMLETNRNPAVDAYRFYIRYYALAGLNERVRMLSDNAEADAIGALLSTSTDDTTWEHQRLILQDELGVTDVIDGLRQLPAMLEKIARDVEESKAKDDRRGARIIDDYDQVHTPAAEDKFVKQTKDKTRQEIAELAEMIGRLERI